MRSSPQAPCRNSFCTEVAGGLQRLLVNIRANLATRLVDHVVGRTAIGIAVDEEPIITVFSVESVFDIVIEDGPTRSVGNQLIRSVKATGEGSLQVTDPIGVSVVPGPFLEDCLEGIGNIVLRRRTPDQDIVVSAIAPRLKRKSIAAKFAIRW